MNPKLCPGKYKSEHAKYLHMCARQTEASNDISLAVNLALSNCRLDSGDVKQEGAREKVSRLIHKLFVTCSTWNTNKNTKSWDIPCCDGTSLEFYSNNNFVSDMKFLCTLYTTKGPTVKAINSESTRATMEVLAHLGEKYNIDFSVPPGSNKVTILRIVKCFPVACCQLYSEGVRKQSVRDTLLGKKLEGKQQAALCVLFPAAASAGLLKQGGKNILPQLLWIAHIQQIATGGAMESAVPIAQLWAALKSIVTCNVIDEHVKMRKCQDWNLLDEDCQPNMIWSETRDICLKKLEQTFHNDPSWGRVKDKIDNFKVSS